MVTKEEEELSETDEGWLEKDEGQRSGGQRQAPPTQATPTCR